MGNTSSGTLVIILDPPPSGTSAYVAGQKISGSVCAWAMKSAKSAKIDVDACLSGKERTRVRYAEDPSDRNIGTSAAMANYAHSDRQIVRTNIRLGSFAGGVELGARHRFPFEIQLPEDLPSSCFVAENHTSSRLGGYCEISYRVKAEIKSGGGMLGNHEVEQIIDVIAKPFPTHPLPNLFPPTTKKVNYLCIGTGTITLGVRVANTRIGRGESAVIDFVCKNQSWRNIKRVTLDVKEYAHWSAGHRSNTSSRTIAFQTFQPDERWQQIATEGELKVMYGDGQKGLLKIIHNAIHLGENRVLLSIWKSGLPSYMGALIKINHRLKIEAFVGGNCTENPLANVPIFLGTPSGLLLPESSKPQPGAKSLAERRGKEWDGALTAAPVVAGQSMTIVGGNATQEGEIEQNMHNFGDALLMAGSEPVPSFPNLIMEIGFAVSPLAAVKRRLNEDAWDREVFSKLTPTQYASLIRAVPVDFHQPEMAALIAPTVGGGIFIHSFVVAALRVVADWVRTPLLLEVLPLCQDLHSSESRIKAELTDWELVCTEKYFEQALTG